MKIYMEDKFANTLNLYNIISVKEKSLSNFIDKINFECSTLTDKDCAYAIYFYELLYSLDCFDFKKTLTLSYLKEEIVYLLKEKNLTKRQILSQITNDEDIKLITEAVKDSSLLDYCIMSVKEIFGFGKSYNSYRVKIKYNYSGISNNYDYDYRCINTCDAICEININRYTEPEDEVNFSDEIDKIRLNRNYETYDLNNYTELLHLYDSNYIINNYIGELYDYIVVPHMILKNILTKGNRSYFAYSKNMKKLKNMVLYKAENLISNIIFTFVSSVFNDEYKRLVREITFKNPILEIYRKHFNYMDSDIYGNTKDDLRTMYEHAYNVHNDVMEGKLSIDSIVDYYMEPFIDKIELAERNYIDENVKILFD